MVSLYIICLLVSILVMAGYCVVNDRYSLNTLGMMLTVVISNAGYLFLAIAKSEDAALAATRVLYVDGAFLPMLIFLSVAEVCQFKINVYIKAAMFFVQISLFMIICTVGYTNLYYKSIKLMQYNGVTYLEKVYGPFHDVCQFTLVGYFIACLIIAIFSFSKKNIISSKNIAVVLGVYILGVVGYFLERVLHLNYEIVPFVNTFLFSCILYPIYRTSSYYYTRDNINRVYEQSQDIGYISFNIALEYTGSNEKARGIFPEMAQFHIDKHVPASAEIINNEIIPLIYKFRENEKTDSGAVKIKDIDYDVKIHKILKRQKKVIGYLVELRDASERQKYIDMVEEYNQKLQKEVEDKTQRVQDMQDRMVMGFDHSETAYSIIKVETDENNRPCDWTYVYMNDSMARLLGIRKEELVGKRFLEVVPDGDESWLNYYYPAAYENKSFIFEASPREIGIFMKVQCFPLDYGFCGCVLEDASSAKELMRNKAEVEMINDALCSDYYVTYVVDMETGSTHTYERNSLFRKSSSTEFVRGHYDDLSKSMVSGNYVLEQDKAEFDPVRDFEQLKKTMANNNHYILSYRVMFHERFMYFQTHFAITYDGNRKYCIIALKSITDQIKKEIEQKQIVEEALAKAEVANESKSTFLSNMSHEIRTPINAILGMDEMIIRECEDANVREYARNIQSAGKTLMSIINEILDFSKIESGKMEIIPVEYDLASIINDLVNMTKPKADEKMLELIIEVDQNTPSLLYGDEIRIKQVLMNILGNAVKYTDVGSITLKVSYENTDSEDSIMLCLAVTDTGKGIKEEDMENLFKPFERIEERRNRHIEGTGLGISITQNLLKLMCSKLEVASVYGEGSTFSCKIPQGLRSTEVIGNMETKFKESLKAESDYKESFTAPDADILFVDDVKMNLTVASALLKTTEAKLDLVTSGQECIAYSSKKKYDIIFLDHMMPGMDGYETLEVLRREGLNQDTPIIILTANAVSGARDKYMEAGFDDYLSKPIESTKLEKMIIKYLPADKVILSPGEAKRNKKDNNISDSQKSEDNQIAEKQNNEKQNPENIDLSGLSDKEKELFNKIGNIGYINLNAGVTASGGADIYIQVLEDIANTGEERISMISKYYEESDIKNYTIQVHALKSISRIAGYLELSEMAAELEAAGNAEDTETIGADTSGLLNMYRKLVTDLGDIFNNDEDKPEISRDELIDGMNSLSEVLEAFDFDTADMIMKALSEYSMPDDFKETFSKIKLLMAQVDRDGLMELINSTKNIWIGE